MVRNESWDEKHKNEEDQDGNDCVADSCRNQGPDDQGQAKQGQTRGYREQQREGDRQDILEKSFWRGFILPIPQQHGWSPWSSGGLTSAEGMELIRRLPFQGF